MNGRIIKQDGGRYIVFDDLPRVRIEGDVDDDVIAQIGGKLIKRAKKKAVKRLKKKSLRKKKPQRAKSHGPGRVNVSNQTFRSSVTLPLKKKPVKKTTKKRQVKSKLKFPDGTAPSLSAGGISVLDPKNPLSTLLMQQSLNKYQQPLFDPKNAIEAPPKPEAKKDEKKEDDIYVYPIPKKGTVLLQFPNKKPELINEEDINTMMKTLKPYKDLKSEVDMISEKKSELESQVFKREQEILAKEQIINSLGLSIDELKKSQGEEKNKLIDAYEKEKKKLIKERDDEIKGLRLAIAAVKDQQKNSDEQQKKLKEAQKKAEDELKKLADDHKKELQERGQKYDEELKKAQKDFDGKMSKLENDKKLLESELLVLKGNIERQKIENVTLGTEIVKLNTSLSTLQESETELKGQLITLQNQKEAIDFDLSTALQALTDANTQKSELITSAKELKQKNDNLSNAINDTELKYQEALKKSGELQKSIIEMSSKIESEKQKYKTLKGKAIKIVEKNQAITNINKFSDFLENFTVGKTLKKFYEDTKTNLKGLPIIGDTYYPRVGTVMLSTSNDAKTLKKEIRADAYYIEAVASMTFNESFKPEDISDDFKKQLKETVADLRSQSEEGIEERYKYIKDFLSNSLNDAKKIKKIKELLVKVKDFSEIDDYRSLYQKDIDFINFIQQKEALIIEAEKESKKEPEREREPEKPKKSKKEKETEREREPEAEAEPEEEPEEERSPSASTDEQSYAREREPEPEQNFSYKNIYKINGILDRRGERRIPFETDKPDIVEYLLNIAGKNVREKKLQEGDISYITERIIETRRKAGQGKGEGGGLFNTEINDMMKKYTPKGFKGVYAVDQLNLIPLKRSDKIAAFVMNTEPITTPSGHWVSIVLTPTNLEYYDSFGEEPSRAFLKNMKRLANAWAPDSLLQFKINRIKFQRANSDNCGYFAMKFIKDRLDGKNFKQATGFEIVSKAIKGEKDIEKFKKRVKEFGSI